MKNKLMHLAYALMVPVVITVLAVACSASAVWGN